MAIIYKKKIDLGDKKLSLLSGLSYKLQSFNNASKKIDKNTDHCRVASPGSFYGRRGK